MATRPTAPFGPTPAVLAEVTRRLVAAFHPNKVILFGSQAWGNPGEDSDIDLLVIVEDSDEAAFRREARAHSVLHGIGVPCDVLVQTRAEMARVNPVRTSLLHRAVTEGRRKHPLEIIVGISAATVGDRAGGMWALVASDQALR